MEKTLAQSRSPSVQNTKGIIKPPPSIVEYLNEFGVEKVLEEAINETLRKRPKDPFLEMVSIR
jgi:hypothetical protein